ncbi:MAG: hypothetical protein V1874_17685 [Spirochaetota bacterium]
MHKRKKLKKILLSFSVFVLFMFPISVTYSEHKQKHPVNKEIINFILNNFKKNSHVTLKEYELNRQWVFTELDIHDEETYPITINVLASLKKMPEKIVYMIAPPGFNFQFNYFSNSDKSIARYMMDNDYLVIGITFRENNLPPETNEVFLKDWGLKKHRLDIRKIVTTINKIIKLPYDMLGQAASAVCVLDYAASYSDNLDTIILLDTDSFDPSIQPEKVQYANMTYSALNQIMDGGTYADPFVINLQNLIHTALLYPGMDSGQSREFMGLPGNFTVNGLVHLALIYTTYMAGIHTPITGLPGEWVMLQGVSAGYYNFAFDPAQDTFGLNNISLPVVDAATLLNGSGITPIAINRDLHALLSLNGQYTINWKGIKEKVIMVNGQYSSGNQTYYGTLIQNAGNNDVSITVIPGYAYLDLLLGENAQTDVWPYFIND